MKITEKMDRPVQDEWGNFWGIRIYSVCITLLLVLFFCSSCNAQPAEIPDMEYYDATDEQLDFDTPGILMYADGVIDFRYSPVTGYVIEYDDPDAFDPDNMLYDETGQYYYILIHCDSSDFFEYFNWYASLKNYYNEEDNTYVMDDRFFNPSETFFIKEEYTDNQLYYSLIKSTGHEE